MHPSSQLSLAVVVFDLESCCRWSWEALRSPQVESRKLFSYAVGRLLVYGTVLHVAALAVGVYCATTVILVFIHYHDHDHCPHYYRDHHDSFFHHDDDEDDDDDDAGCCCCCCCCCCCPELHVLRYWLHILVGYVLACCCVLNCVPAYLIKVRLCVGHGLSCSRTATCHLT